MAMPATLGHNAPHGVVGIFNTNTDHKAATWITLLSLLFIAIIIVVGIILFSAKQKKKIKPTPEETYQCKDGKCSLTQGSGGFPTQSLCERNCKPAVKRWSCNVGDGTCAEGYGPGYSTEEICKKNCSKVEKSWQCSVNGCRQMSLPGKQSYTFEECTKKCKKVSTCAADPPRCVSKFTDDEQLKAATCTKDANCLSKGEKYVFDESIPGCTVTNKDDGSNQTFDSLDDCMTKGGGNNKETGKGCEGLSPSRVYCKDARNAVCALSQNQCCGVVQCDSCAKCVKATEHGETNLAPAYCSSSCTSKESKRPCFLCSETGDCQCNPSNVYSELSANQSCVCTVSSDDGVPVKYPCSVAKVMRNQGSVIESCDHATICTIKCQEGNPYLAIVKATPKGTDSTRLVDGAQTTNVMAQACLTASEFRELAQLTKDKEDRVDESKIKSTAGNNKFADALKGIFEDVVIANDCDMPPQMSNNLCLKQCNA